MSAQAQNAPVIAPWIKERARVLLGICQRIQQQHEVQGLPLRRAFERAARRLQGRCYRCDRSRSLALSVGTLRRVYYAWSSSPELSTLQLHYAPPTGSKVTPGLLRAFLKHCLRAGVVSFLEAYAALQIGRKRSLPSYSLLLKHLSPRTRARLNREFRRRRSVRRAETRFARLGRAILKGGGQ